MRTKDEILNDFMDYDRTRSSIKEAMDEYAKEVAIDFAKWTDDNGYTQTLNASWANLQSEDIQDEQLFELFKAVKGIQ